LVIRLAQETDAARIREVILIAGAAFREAGMAEVSDNPPGPVEEIAATVRGGLVWVAVDADDSLVGCAFADVVDGTAHVEQVSVHPDSAGRGLGALLVDRIAEWGAEQGLSALTLTTFADVPWNGPYYRRLGFVEIPDAELGPQLRSIREVEAALGLDRWPRIAMTRELVARS
jgi:GNAT superfamily N-acetyltransferase